MKNILFYPVNIFNRFQVLDASLKAFLLGILFLGINNGILNATFNNYLHDYFNLSSSERGFLEFPRELPGFLLIFITALLAFLPVRLWAVIVGLVSAAGVFGLGWFSPGIRFMILWMILWSLGDHLFMPVESTIGLWLSKEGGQGKRLGQISGARNLAMILGSLAVIVSFDKLRLSYSAVYIVGAIAAILASIAFSRVRIDSKQEIKNKKFIYRPRYHLYYVLNILFGARKQLFLTFSPWVLISIFGTTPQTIAALILVAALLGVFFRQLFGILVDRYGEQFTLKADAFILLLICLGFALIKNVYVLYSLYVLDNLMFAARIARTTYLNKITQDKRDISSTLSLGVTLDHVVSMSIPVVGGLLWTKLGYPAVFLAAVLLSVANFLAAMKINSSIAMHSLK